MLIVTYSFSDVPADYTGLRDLVESILDREQEQAELVEAQRITAASASQTASPKTLAPKSQAEGNYEKTRRQLKQIAPAA